MSSWRAFARIFGAAAGHAPAFASFSIFPFIFGLYSGKFRFIAATFRLFRRYFPTGKAERDLVSATLADSGSVDVCKG
jgi:hypothetical protein